jgi:hypothetical protein
VQLAVRELGEREAAAVPRVRILLVREHLEHALDDIVCHVERQARGHTADALRRRPAHHGVAVAQPAEELLDDLLDVLSPEEQLGKRPGTDLRERKPSLVNLLWLASGSPLAKKLLIAPKADADTNEEEEYFISEAIAEIISSDVIATAREHAQSEAQAAEQALQTAAKHAKSAGVTIHEEALAAIEGIIKYTVDRMS